LAQLQSRYESKGFTVIAFPTDDFHQELSSNEDIQEFVQENFPQATFPVMGTSSLESNPAYQQLRRQMPETHVQHNFYKYLCNRKGVAVKFYTKKQDPLSLVDDIEELLNAEDGILHKYVTH
jgi:glutathione peroxidase